MSAAPWTPGPWILTQDQRHLGVDGTTPVAEPVALNQAEFDRVNADRRLIAAAPEMAEVLEQTMIGIGMGWDLDGYVIQIQQLLARIRGEAE